MPFAIVAGLPLGTYRGAGQDGRPEPMPSVVRLHSALLCAAGFGPRAVPRDGALAVCEADEAALDWLEHNPPDSVRIPALQINAGRAVAYRDDGTIKKTKTTATIKKLPKNPDANTAADGRFEWIWQEAPPPPVRAAIEQLCPDVACLGTSESPVRLTAVTGDGIEPTHDRDADAGLFGVGLTVIERPLPGRTAELADAHYAATGKPPSAARDRFGSDEKSLSPVPPRQAVAAALYRALQRPSPDVPWPQVIVVPLDQEIEVKERLAWAVAAHRALIKLIGYGAPPLVTGAYPAGAPRPANRLALHLLDPGMPVEAGACQAKASLAMLVPHDAEPSDFDMLQRAVEGLTSLRGPGGRICQVIKPGARVLDGSRFWRAPEPGRLRLWRTVPAAVPDTRGARGQEWTFAHAALLSLGFVWKDCLPRVPGRGDDYYRALAAAASERGAAVVHVKAVRTAEVRRYAHKVNEHAVVRPYTAYLSLGDLAGPGTVQAIGQSRHLGGGLLVPFDIADGTPAGSVSLPGSAEDGGGS
jgi:CRISPR-associated protein Csb2